MLVEIVEFIVKGLVEHPDRVRVTVQDSEASFLIAIVAGDSEKGRLIGRDGKTINALRTLLTALAPEGKKVSVEIVSQ